MSVYANIPIFIPHLACPHQCIYCNQREITGQLSAPAPQEIHSIIQTHLKTLKIKEVKHIQIAFFGGNFTALPFDLMHAYLKEAFIYVQKGDVAGIRLSTRPDDIDEKILAVLQLYGVTHIELGAQSLDTEVLQFCERGHNVEDVVRASALIKQKGFVLGLQMMVGLPKDTDEKCMETARKIIALGAEECRIYPCLVIEQTDLHAMFCRGTYHPLSLNAAIDICKDLLVLFEQHGVKILRVGLHPSEGLLNKTAYAAGPFHVSFRELVESRVWLSIFEKIPSEEFVRWGNTPALIKIKVPVGQVNAAIGYRAENASFLREKIGKCKFYEDACLEGRNYCIEA